MGAIATNALHGSRNERSGPRSIAWVLAILVGFFAVGGFADSLVTPIPVLSLDWEVTWSFNLPASFSAGMLLCAGLAAVAVAQVEPGMLRYWSLYGLLAALFAFMSIDELLEIHEQLGGWDWQMFYLPIALAAGFLWAGVLLRMLPWDRRMLLIWVGGAACWLASQVLEELQWNGSTAAPLYEWLMPTEELLEMSGSALLLIGLLLLRTELRTAGLRRPSRPAAFSFSPRLAPRASPANVATRERVEPRPDDLAGSPPTSPAQYRVGP